MIVLVINVSRKAKDTPDNASSAICSDVLQIEEPFTGNSEQEDVDIGLFPREFKDNFSAVVESHFGISSADCMLLDSPPTVVLRNYEKCLPDLKKLSEFMSFVTEYLKQNHYLKSDYHVTVERILRDEKITEFFFNYYAKVRSALQNIITSDSSVLQSIYKENFPGKYILLLVPSPADPALLELPTFLSEPVESVHLNCQSLKCSFMLIKLPAVESNKMPIDRSSDQSNRSFSVFSTPAEINEQLFPLFTFDVSIVVCI
jgi:hypothetical protein